MGFLQQCFLSFFYQQFNTSKGKVRIYGLCSLFSLTNNLDFRTWKVDTSFFFSEMLLFSWRLSLCGRAFQTKIKNKNQEDWYWRKVRNADKKCHHFTVICLSLKFRTLWLWQPLAKSPTTLARRLLSKISTKSTRDCDLFNLEFAFVLEKQSCQVSLGQMKVEHNLEATNEVNKA